MNAFPPPYNYWASRPFGADIVTDLDTYFYLFPYIMSRSEYDFVAKKRVAFSTNRYGTYWTTLLTDDPVEAMRKLALRSQPIYRLGGVPLATVDRSAIRYQGGALPRYGQPGGAIEIVVAVPILITSIYDFNNSRFTRI